MTKKNMKTDDSIPSKVVPIKQRNCAQCDKPAVHEFRPFCSRRCANLDLGNWFNESYTVPAVETDDLDESFFEEEG